MPERLRPEVGSWLFGCDVCQDVCPWNRKAPWGTSPELQPRPELLGLDLIDVLNLSDEDFRRCFRGTALWRTKRRGLVRNAAIVAGNLRDVRTLPALERLSSDLDPVIADACAGPSANCKSRSGIRQNSEHTRLGGTP